MLGTAKELLTVATYSSMPASMVGRPTITYIRLQEEFVYLAVVLDAYSRLVIGWALERTLEAKLSIGALRMAMDRRGVSAGLIHHSDRGVLGQFNRWSQHLSEYNL